MCYILENYVCKCGELPVHQKNIFGEWSYPVQEDHRIKKSGHYGRHAK